MGAWLSSNTRGNTNGAGTRKRRRTVWEETYPRNRTPKLARQESEIGELRVCRGDDVELIAAPLTLDTGQLVPPRDSSHFARVVDPRYEREPEAAVLVVQWYYRRHEVVTGAVPEPPGVSVELIESSERALVRTSALVRRIDIGAWPGAGAEFFAGRHTREFGELADRRARPPHDRARPQEGLIGAEPGVAELESVPANDR